MTAPAPLAVFAQISLLTGEGDDITVTAADAVITVVLPRLWLRRSALGPLADRSRRHHVLINLHQGLQAADLTLQIQAGRRVVAQLRPQSRPALLSRWLGLGAMEVRIIPCLLALLRW